MRRIKCYVAIDETYDSYTGRLLKKEKKHEDKLTSEEKQILKYIHNYKPKKGDTCSYKYLVFALVYGNKRTVIRVNAIKRKENYKSFNVQTLLEIQKRITFECALFDRGFYDGEFLTALKNAKISFICRARIFKTMMKLFGFYKE